MPDGMGVVLRAVEPADQTGLLALADILDTVNLPDDPAEVAKIIATSQSSFAASAAGGDAPPINDRTYTLVAQVDGRVLGTGSLFARHGVSEDPHYYLRVITETVHSRQLGTGRERHLLRLGRDIEPWTELGALVVHPDARGKGLGKLLVASRLLCVAMHRDWYCQRLLAELLPPRQGKDGNAFWDAVGGPLTGLDYYRADLLCRSEKEFIDSFFPTGEILMDLLPVDARSVVGQVGPDTEPVRKLLERAGLRYLHTVDPFDGGPHYGARVEEIGPISRSRPVVVLDAAPQGDAPTMLVGNPRNHRFAAITAQVADQGLRISDAAKQQLALNPGHPAWVMPLDW